MDILFVRTYNSSSKNGKTSSRVISIDNGLNAANLFAAISGYCKNSSLRVLSQSSPQNLSTFYRGKYIMLR